jgi:hypothetical protein
MGEHPPEEPERATEPSARPAVFALGFLVGIWGLTVLLAIIAIELAHAWWGYLFLIPPVVLGLVTVADAVVAARKPDEVEPLRLEAWRT